MNARAARRRVRASSDLPAPPISMRAALFVALGLVAALAGLMVVNGGGDVENGDAGDALDAPEFDSGADRGGSVALDDVEAPAISDEPASYELTYRVEGYANGQATVTTERFSVVRPFDSRIDVLDGAPPGGDLVTARASAFGRLGTVDARGAWTVLQVPPALAVSDVRPGPALAEALERGLVDRREDRRVAGRRCAVIRAGGPVSAGEITPVSSETPDTYADVCVDAAGMVLEEVWVSEGVLLRRRLAVDLALDAVIPAERFVMPSEGEVGVEEGNGSTRALDPTSRPPGTTWELPQAPEGFERRGRYAVVSPELSALGAGGGSAPDSSPNRVVGIVDVWVRGADALIVSQGASVQGGPPFGRAPGAEEVDLGPLGPGEAILDLRGNQVRTVLEGGSFVAVSGTLPLATLIGLARSLEPVEGGELVDLDENG